MDYSKLSDLEINKRVARHCLGGRAFGVVDGRVETFGGTFDPCNNPADAWRIIVANKISLMWMTAEEKWSAAALGELEEGCWEWSYTPDHYIDDSNPLRAAMIVFLMMQGGE